MNTTKKIQIILFAFFTMIVSAQTKIYVSQYAGSDANDGTSWIKAYKTIRAAFTKIGTATGTYEVYVAQGLYILDGNGGPSANEIQLGAGQYVRVLGGYATPSNGVTPAYNPLVYTTSFDSVDGSTFSSFRMINGSDASLFLKDLSIVNSRGGGSLDGTFITFDQSNGSSFTMDNVKVHEWEGGDGVSGDGFTYVYQSINTNINIKNSLVERLTNKQGAGQFITTGSQTKNLDINVDNTVFRNIRSSGLNAALFQLNLNCNDDQGQSSLTINKSSFENIKRGRAAAQSVSVIYGDALPLLSITDSKFFGNQGGNGGVIELNNSGRLISKGNLYQDNYAGQAGGVYNIHGVYPCTIVAVGNALDFTNDKFIANHAGMDGLSGRGGAILVAGDVVGTGLVDKPIHITSSEFYDNFTSAFDGGAVFARTSQEFIVKSSVFCTNEANRWFEGNSAGNGGAIFAVGTGIFEVHGSTFVSNRGDQSGGAIFSDRVTTIDQCSYFEKNVAVNRGGAVWVDNKTTIDSSYFTQNSSGMSGGALFFNTPNVHTIQNSTFTGNLAGNGGAAIYANNDDLTNSAVSLAVQASYFLNNTASKDGGAIELYYCNATLTANYFDKNTGRNGGALFASGGDTKLITSTGNYFFDNKSSAQGGAISSWVDINSTNDNFYRNIATVEGGAIRMERLLSNLTTNNSMFYANSAVNGGAVSAQISFNSTNDNFYKNIATGDGGAVRMIPINSKLTTNNTMFYANSAVNGGAVRLYGIGDFTNNTKFLKNTATTDGGAVFTQDTGVTGNGDALFFTNSYAFGNTANGSATTINSSEFFLPKGPLDYYVNAVITNSKTQLVPSTTNYPAGSLPDNGYTLTGTNTQSTSMADPSNPADPTYTPKSCAPLACPVKLPTPVAPITVSAQGSDINSGVVGSYITYTDVPVDAQCKPAATEVAFSARSNEAESENGTIIPSPTPELKITYSLTVVHNRTGILTTTQGLTINSSNATRVEDPSDEIDPSSPRDLYKTYYLNVTPQVQTGYTYIYSITQVEIVGGNTFTFADGLYSTILAVGTGVNCGCYDPANTAEQGTDTKHGISAMQRAGSNNGGWPMLRKSAYTALEAKTKGLVITRTTSPETAIEKPVLGMAVFDTDENAGVGCLKIYTTGGWKCFTKPACP